MESNTNLKTALSYVNEELSAEGLDLEMLKLKTQILLLQNEFDSAVKAVDEALAVSPEDEGLLELKAKVGDARRKKPAKGGKHKRFKGPQVIRLEPD
jgi:predicted ATP-grasp superfamily ATP-dependent carboligase